MLRGADPSELEVDLAKVERCLQSLDTDGALLPQERELRGLYYTHLRDKIRFHLPRRSEAAQEKVRTDVSAINEVKVSDESWKAITPPGLINAVAHIRKDFEDMSANQRRHFQEQCFNNLHPLTAGFTEPSVFRKHFYGCVEKLCRLVPNAFGRLLGISLAQDGTIGDAPVEWAALQVTDLIEYEDRAINRWIKCACDPQSKIPIAATAQEVWDKFVLWTDWRAPKWLYMEPNGNAPYDASTAWERMDEASTKDALKALRETRWIFSLESTLKERVGTAHEVLARREKTSRARSQQQPREPVAPSARKSSRERSEADRAPLNYRSGVKRAILIQLTKQPKATDAEICRGLDADGAVELPPEWKNKREDRRFFDAYSDARRRHKVEVTISKVRQDLRKLGLRV